MSNKMYPQAQERVNFYKHSEEMLSVPRDYFEELRKGLYSELSQDYVETKVCLAHHLQITLELGTLKRIIAMQDSRLTELEQRKKTDAPEVVVLEEISKEEGKKLVEDYFKEHGCADIEELMLNLRIPVQVIVEIVDELRNEGKLTPKGEKKG
jgi:hypothetical protein